MIVAATFIFTSCEKVLNFQGQMSLNSETALSSTQGLQTALIGAYDRLQSGDLYGGNIWSGGEILAGNAIKSGEGNIVYEETQMIDKILTPDNRISASLWSNAYWTINEVNSIIQAIPDVNDDDIEANKNRIKGEALFIRALLHFDLVRYFGNHENGYNNGLGVPLLTEPTGITGKPARASIDEVYEQCITDLKEAIDLLPVTNSNRATSYAASALLSRIYFYHQDWKKAIDAADFVINSGAFVLSDSMPLNYADYDQEGLSKEVIFAVMSSESDISCGTLNNYYRKAGGPKFSPSNNFVFIMSTDGSKDKRFAHFFAQIDSKWFTTKFDNKYFSVPIIRLAELYLIRGEAKLMSNNPDGAKDDINIIRHRAGLEDLTTKVSPIKFYIERTRELCFEGDNFFNMKRLGYKIAGYDWNARELLYLIPQRELDVNPNLVQN